MLRYTLQLLPRPFRHHPAGNDKHKMLYAVYCYYYVPGRHSLQALMEDALILAKVRPSFVKASASSACLF